MLTEVQYVNENPCTFFRKIISHANMISSATEATWRAYASVNVHGNKHIFFCPYVFEILGAFNWDSFQPANVPFLRKEATSCDTGFSTFFKTRYQNFFTYHIWFNVGEHSLNVLTHIKSDGQRNFYRPKSAANLFLKVVFLLQFLTTVDDGKSIRRLRKNLTACTRITQSLILYLRMK